MKTKTNALLLAFFLGGVGGHKFYLDKPGQGVAYLLFCWTFIPGLIAIADMLHLALMSDQEFHQRFNRHLLNPAAGYPQMHGMYGAPQHPQPGHPQPGYPQPGYQQPYGQAPPPAGYGAPPAYGQAPPAHGQPPGAYGQPPAPAAQYGQPPAQNGPAGAYVPAPVAPAGAAPTPPSGDYAQRLAYLEHLRQTGALNEEAYEAAKTELRRSH